VDIIRPRSDPHFAPTTPGQRKEWQLHHRRSDTSFMNMSRVYRFGTAIDTTALAESVRILVSRHDALRTRIQASGDRLVQVIEEQNSPLISGLSCTREASGMTLATWLAQTTRKGFDLTSEIPARIAFFEDLAGGQFLAIVLHHIISDHISMGVILQELSALLAALTAGRQAELPVIPLQFPDYASWYADQEMAGHFGPSFDYWVQALDGAPERTPIPVTGDSSEEGARSEVADMGVSVRDLRHCARSLRSTPYVVLLTLFSAALSGLTDADDQVFGCGYGSRPAVGLRDSVGRFVNQLPLRTRNTRRLSASDAVASVHQTAMLAYANSVAALDAVVERGLLGECRTEIPFTNIAFQLLQQNAAGFAGPGVDAQPVVAPGVRVMRRDLLAAVLADGERLITQIDYQPALTSPASVSDLMGDFRDRVAALVRAEEA
jgi:Condensation domain